MKIIKTWSETKEETKNYLSYNGYGKSINLFGTNYYLTERKGNNLKDVKIII